MEWISHKKAPGSQTLPFILAGAGGGMLFANMSVRSLQRQDSVREELKESFHMESGVSTPKTSIVAGLCNR